MFTSILNTSSGSLSFTDALWCTLASLAAGIVIAFIYTRKGTYTKSFVTTLVLLPTLVQTVIMMVNGNLGVGVAVLGTFSLVRFRSSPGSAKEISCIFFAMAVGLATGMGYLTFAAGITGVIGLAMLILNFIPIGETKSGERELKITIPEDLDYTEIFDDLFEKYTAHHSLDRVKTTNMGSMYELKYSITLRDSGTEKAFIDEIRCRNGNLPIVSGRPQTVKDEL